MMKSFLLLGAALLAAPAAAQEAAPPTSVAAVQPGAETPDPATLQAARELLVKSGFEQQMEETVRRSSNATFDTITSSFERQQGELPADLKARMRQVMMADVDGLIADMKRTALDKSAAVYARYFTAEELRELTRLQDNPVLAKFRRIAPSFVTELSQVGVGIAAERLPALQAKIKKAIDDWAASQPDANLKPKRS